MSDLISRQDALNQITAIETSIIPYARAREYVDELKNYVIKIIETLPSAEPERKEKIHDDKIHPVIHYCGKDIVTLINPTWNYCPYCGKKLEWI